MIDLENLEPHPFANIFPMLKPAELKELGADIAAVGLREKIILFEDHILDGRNRYAAMKLAGIPLDTAEPGEESAHFRVFEGTEDEALAQVKSRNLHRRHLDTSQRAMAAAAFMRMNGTHTKPSEGGPGKRTKSEVARGVPTVKERRQKAGDIFNVSDVVIRQAEKIREIGGKHVAELVQSGELTVSAAEIFCRAHPDKMRQRAFSTGQAINEEVARIRAARPMGSWLNGRLCGTVAEVASEFETRGADGVPALTAEEIASLEAGVRTLAELLAMIPRPTAAEPLPATAHAEAQ